MDKKKILEIVQASGWELQNLPDDSLKKDKEIVLIALKNNRLDHTWPLCLLNNILLVLFYNFLYPEV